MFTTSVQPAPFTNLFSLTPQPRHPSPLAPRHANLAISHPVTTMSHSKPQSQTIEHANTQEKTTTPSPSLPKQSYADRYARQIRNPAAQIARQNGSREKRRDMFLNRVKRDRDEGRFEARGEQVQRINYLAQQRRYQEAIARSAPDFGPMMEEVEGGVDKMVFDEGGQGMGLGWKGDRGDGVEDELILEEFISQEEEYQAFLEELERSREDEQQSQQCPPSSQYDDEEDYENIFADLLDDDHHRHQHHQNGTPGHNDSMNDGMDTSYW
ncbi:hypothetical protein EMCG_08794 [[Emmonsia] crescens]|uniref:Uncharacterized protein n=1 Tax=[Emmonsia] crescens TaxID=73230 RepID=A0A0G2I555_9EURO|nr:hypothetical protein EMCG_08794 [Emmonsia crescens UAMH 3008]